MPKGVEHQLLASAQIELMRVESLMPKGVEHATTLNTIILLG